MKKFFQQAFSGNSVLHGAFTTVIAFILSSLLDAVNNSALPTEAQMIAMAKGALVLGLSYLLKNGFFGSSGTKPITPPLNKV